MLGLMTVRAHKRAMLEAECELQHEKKENEYLRRREQARIACVEALEAELQSARGEKLAAERAYTEMLEDYGKIARKLAGEKAASNAMRTRAAFMAAEAERARDKIKELELLRDSLEAHWRGRADPELETEKHSKSEETTDEA